MKRFITLIDIALFIVLGSLFFASAVIVIIIFSILPKKRNNDHAVNRLSFVIADYISGGSPYLEEDVLLDGYISRDYSIYIDYVNNYDRFKKIGKSIEVYSIAAHPGTLVYNMGFRALSALVLELKVLRMAFSISGNANISFIESHDPHILGLNGLIVSRVLRLPAILHINSDFNMKYKGTSVVSNPVFFSRGIERAFERIIMAFYDLLMVDREYYRRSGMMSKRCANRYRSFGVRVDLQHYAERPGRKDLRHELGIGGKRAILYVGRLHPVKYPEDAMRALTIVRKRGVDAVLLMAGDGVLREKLEEMARREAIADSVLFLGQVDSERLVDLYASSDILIAPHGGVTLVESALAATPAVAYDFDWHSEFIDDGRNGLLVKFHDVESLASSCVRLLRDSAFRDNCAALAREKAFRMCSRQASIDRQKSIYEEVLKK